MTLSPWDGAYPSPPMPKQPKHLPTDPATIALHADRGIGDTPDVGPPIHTTTTYRRHDQAELVYSREGDQVTWSRLEAVLGALEGGRAVCFSSGMAATAAVLDVVAPSRVAVPEDVYLGVRELIVRGAQGGRWQITDPGDLREGDLRWIETPSNPKCLVTDISEAATEAKSQGAIVAVDSTFATPLLQRPRELGADLVVHSTTKFIGGHSDALGGAVIGDSATADALRDRRRITGATPGSLESWLTLRGLRTLALRLPRQTETAHKIARWLEDRVEIVWYPWLESHPHHQIARRQMSGGGGVLSFELSDERAAKEAVGRLDLFTKATSLGGVESLAEHRRSIDPHAPPALIRLSVGLEAASDLIADLDQALSA